MLGEFGFAGEFVPSVAVYDFADGRVLGGPQVHLVCVAVEEHNFVGRFDVHARRGDIAVVAGFAADVGDPFATDCVAALVCNLGAGSTGFGVRAANVGAVERVARFFGICFAIYGGRDGGKVVATVSAFLRELGAA